MNDVGVMFGMCGEWCGEFDFGWNLNDVVCFCMIGVVENLNSFCDWF